MNIVHSIVNYKGDCEPKIYGIDDGTLFESAIKESREMMNGYDYIEEPYGDDHIALISENLIIDVYRTFL